MIPRAKCRLCQTLVEIKNPLDIFTCSCGELQLDAIWGTVHAKVKDDISNLILIDDEGNEVVHKRNGERIESTAKEILKDMIQASEGIDPYSKREHISLLKQMAQNIDSLPPSARSSPVTHSDLSSLISLLVELFCAS